tara:strand:+ start:312 stop:1688 length:1377 start_codon:yes stop_codon:yes gene_type:complete
MREYIEPTPGVEDMTDSVEKILPALAAGARAVMASPTGRKVVAQGAMMGADAIRQKLESKKQEVAAAEQELQQAEQERAQQEQIDAQQPAPPAPEEGQGAEIEGMDSAESDVPTEQEGTALPPEAPRIPIAKMNTWFQDNFGMTGRELTEILIKGNEVKVLDSIQPLLLLEKQATLSQFPGVSPDLVGSLPLTDLDYDSLNQNSERLNLPFRRFVKSWVSASDEEGRDKAEKLWRTTLDKSERLSHRERGILNNCRSILSSRGAVNAQTLKSYGVQASPAEISSLIKSHGFLFDIIAIGQFSKSMGRGLFYDIKRRDVILKDADQFLAGLIDNSSLFKFDTRLYPRLEINFNAPSAPWYAEALKKEGIAGIKAEGSGLVIEGDTSVLKALEMAEPHLSDRGEYPSPRNMLSALRGDRDTLIVMAYDTVEAKDRSRLLRKHKLSVDEFDNMKEAVKASG